MKLIIYSIICGVLGLISGSIILHMGGQISDLGIGILGLIGFFSPGLYVLNKLHEKSKKETI